MSPMDPNVAETESARRKQFNHDACHFLDAESPASPLKPRAVAEDSPQPKHLPSPTQSSPIASSAATASQDGSKAQVPATKAAIKRKRLTAEEREEPEQEEKKALLSKEREEKRRRKEEDDRIKAEKKLQKDLEQKRAHEEKAKKARSQMKLNAFFDRSKTPKPTSEAGSESGTPIAPEDSAPIATTSNSIYGKIHPFFCRKNTRLNTSVAKLDEDTREAKTRNLDSFIAGGDEMHLSKSSEILSVFKTTCSRGRLYHPVRHIMERAYQDASGSGGRVGSSMSDTAFEEARKRLAEVPVKIIAFAQDVRPPYYGTVTAKPFAMGQKNMYRLARKPVERRLALNYDYDSEAEWQDEEGEDVDIDDDEEEVDEDDDMEGFLDDSEDLGPSSRQLANLMEPQSTGLCFEDQNGHCLFDGVKEYRLEMMMGEQDGEGIDPWSMQYWEGDSKTTTRESKDLHFVPCSGHMAPPPVPVRTKLKAEIANRSMKLVKPTLMDGVKQAILDHSTYSKMGIIDIIWRQFQHDSSRTEVKNTIELVAEKKGAGRLSRWDLKAGHGISQGSYDSAQ
ncbi:hypothetical protein CDD81_5983 [Ophiocordyceps australis]|uniref:Chromatin assembly factor 1 subunit p150 C-terminal domain-containing protein n=1 Tax=Ophiocordyceps australis TaxID=1399860 RepID=A0A2C5Y803_9HYPO|nr:hypothetical protein CDD81_5983 [Ophiocordyceps australis]